MDDLLPIILDMLQDSSALQKREVAKFTNVCFHKSFSGLHIGVHI